MNFLSDNAAPVAPAVLDAIVQANEGFAIAYGDDEWTRSVERHLSALFERAYRPGTVLMGRLIEHCHMRLDAGKQAADDRVERSLYQRANGYSHPAVKTFMTRDGKTVEHKYTEHYPPDTTAAIFFLKNRRPDRWRDVQNIEAQHGLYIISDRPLTEEEWIREHCSNADQLDLEAKAIEHDANDRESNS